MDKMISWEDTVMDDEEVKQELAKYDIPEVYIPDEIIADMVKQIGNIIAITRKAQAEISFTAGEKQGYGKGTRKVVEFVNSILIPTNQEVDLPLPNFYIRESTWQAQLKK